MNGSPTYPTKRFDRKVLIGYLTRKILGHVTPMGVPACIGFSAWELRRCVPSLVSCIMAETPFFLFCHSLHLSLRRKKGSTCFKEIPSSLPGSDEDCRPIERNWERDGLHPHREDWHILVYIRFVSST